MKNKATLVLILATMAITALYACVKNTLESRMDIINMNDVYDFDVTETGLTIYLKDGSSYYWER